MKRLLLFALTVMMALGTASAQEQKKAPLSPAATAAFSFGDKSVRIDYSSPRVRGREGKLFGKDGQVGKDSTYPVWRAGANAATKLHTDADIVVGGLSVPKGDYTLYVDVTDPLAWKLIISKQTGQWGTVYDKALDLGRVDLQMSKSPALVEELVYSFTAVDATHARLTLSWENVVASVEIAAK